MSHPALPHEILCAWSNQLPGLMLEGEGAPAQTLVSSVTIWVQPSPLALPKDPGQGRSGGLQAALSSTLPSPGDNTSHIQAVASTWRYLGSMP